MTQRVLSLNRREFVQGVALGGACLCAGRLRGADELDPATLLISNCTERVVDFVGEDSKSDEAKRSIANQYQKLQKMVQEDPEAQQRFLSALPAGAPAAAPTDGIPNGPFELAISKSLFWKNISSLDVRFLSTPLPAIRQAIMDAITIWNEHLPFPIRVVGGGNAQIKVNFLPGKGHWSYVGTSSLGQVHSMNIQPNVTGEKFLRVALHEFGHALGAIHEHQSPNVTIPWRRDTVYAYYQRTQGWDRNMTDAQVLNKYSNASEFNASQYDSTSIMQYPIPAELLTTGKAVDWNDRLSPLDIAFIRKTYGMPPLKPGESEKPGEPKKAEREGRTKLRVEDAVAIVVGETKSTSFKEPGELLLYRFDVDSKQEFVLETVESPAHDVVIELYQEPPFVMEKALKVSDSVSGRRLLNAALRATLDRGRYYVLVRHSVHSRVSGFALHLREAAKEPADSWKSRIDGLGSRQDEVRSNQEKFPTRRK